MNILGAKEENDMSVSSIEACGLRAAKDQAILDPIWRAYPCRENNANREIE